MGLGVEADIPAVAIQSPLVDGVHLRWAVRRVLGFPWWGFFLFRRPVREGGRICIGEELRKLRQVDPLPSPLALAAGTFSSDRPLRARDDFPPPGELEIDLGQGRAWLRFALGQGVVASRIWAKVGFRRSRTQRFCIDLRDIIRTPAANPLRLSGIVVAIDHSSGRPALISPALRLEGGRFRGGLSVSREAQIDFDEPVAEASILVAVNDRAVTAIAYGRDGKEVARTQATGSDGAQLELALAGRQPIARVVLQKRGGVFALLQICRWPVGDGRESLRMVASRSGMTVAETLISGKPGEVVEAELAADEIDEVTFLPAKGEALPEAALIDLCFRSLNADRRSGWRPLERCPQPLTLPLFHPDYPASGGRPTDLNASETMGLGRIRYGDPSDYGGQSFSDLHDALIELVVGGPGGPPMADPQRAGDIPAGSASGGALPTLAGMHPLDLVLLASVHPAAAQLLGLYWADETAKSGERYDYLVIGDWSGAAGTDAMKVLSQWLADAAGYLGYIVHDKGPGPVPALAEPTGLRAYSLPGPPVMPAANPTDPPQAVAGLVGLRWDIPYAAGGVLLPGSPALYHLWRNKLGNGASPDVDPALGTWLTKSAPVLVTQPINDPFATPQWPAGWPERILYRIDRVNAEGWYGYQASAMDLFGRISRPSPRFPWHQWTPAPDPAPWYYQLPASNAQINADAVRVLDKNPPPAPVGVEAAALDPADPYVLADAPYLAWRAGLPAAVRDTLVGLRVEWRWTAAQMFQAPDTKEFRIYYNPGGAAPAPDPRIAANWAQRVHVVAFADEAEIGSGGERIYRVFLPVPSPAVFAAGVPLTPSLADPIAYAHVGVAAADGALHTPDDAKWAAGAFGNRSGNEGRMGTPAKVFRVWRQAPPAPAVPADAERVYATAADYHAKSFYTYRWQPQPHLKAHILRAMDASVFSVDRGLRPRNALTAATAMVYPDPAIEPRWDAVKRAQVAAALNALNNFPATAAGELAAAAAYRALSNDALRVLAGLPGNEAAFAQVTVTPLDPDDISTANRVGPDNAADFAVNPALRVWIDTLDGRSTNRWFYRAVYVDGAHNRSALSLSGPPVWLPNVVPPRAPSLTKALGKQQRIELSWASNRESDLAAYRVYRATDRSTAADSRAMTMVGTVAVPAGDPAARPASVSWADDPVPALTTFWYVLTALDDAGNESAASAAIAARAFDETLPSPPPLTAAWTAPVAPASAQVGWTSPDETRLERRVVGSLQWDPVGGWRAPGSHNETIALATTLSWRLRLRVRKATGAQAIGAAVPLNQL
jgi:hypothetical protein